MRPVSLTILLGLLSALPISAQGWGFVQGKVVDGEARLPLSKVTVLVADTDFGTITDADGMYRLRLPVGTSKLRFSYIGFTTYTDSVTVRRNETTELNVRLKWAVTPMSEIGIIESRPLETGVFQLTPDQLRNIPGPLKDGFRALKVLPGVVSNNELSNEYSVRGGGFNENQIFLDGFEIYKPARTRQGEQEGLGLFNPELASGVTLYAGGFPVRYGGKLSSVLDITYALSDAAVFTGSAYISQLDGGIRLGGGTGESFKWKIAGRKARARSFFSSQELKGSYDPDYTDLQVIASYKPSRNWELGMLAVAAQHRFRLEPSERRTYFGTYRDLRSAWFNYSGIENDGYDTNLWGIKSIVQLSSKVRSETRLSWFETEESEEYDITGAATLYLVDPTQTDPDSPRDDIPVGGVTQKDQADNRVTVRSLTADTRWLLAWKKSTVEFGLSAKQYLWSDHLFESTSVVGQNQAGDLVQIELERLEDALPSLTSYKTAAYAQTEFDLLPERGKWKVSTGIRIEYFGFNEEWTVSPRFSSNYVHSDQLSMHVAGGIYYQTPSYRELRGEPAVEESIEGSLNKDIRSQKSSQIVLGGEYFIPRSRLYLRGELYYKKLDRLISYGVRNTRLDYSGENDSFGDAYGLDVQLRGEFVPGLESWFNYSYLNSREKFESEFVTPYNFGWRPRAMDQTHTVSLYIQDYLPSNKEWMLNMRLLFGSGLPYTPPVPGEQINSITLQEPGQRHSQRFLAYRRVDMGVTRVFTISDRASKTSGKVPTLQLSAELLNIFDSVNTIAYSWIAGSDGIWQRIPTRLTPRLFTVRARIEF